MKYRVIKADNRFGFESAVEIGTITANNDEELDKEMHDLYRYYADSCHTTFRLIPIK